MHISLIYVAAILGFMAWNYPLELIFLGDSAAPTSWLFRFLAGNNATSTLFRGITVDSLMTWGYPVMEILCTMQWRRPSQQSSRAPDTLHLHSLIDTVFIRERFQRMRVARENIMAALMLIPFVDIIAFTGMIFIGIARCL